MAYSSTYSERYYGIYTYSAGSWDAYSYLNSDFVLAAGSAGYGELTYQSLNNDIDIYSLGILGAGYYSVDVDTYTWDYTDVGFGGIGSFQVLNSSGSVVGTSYLTNSDIQFTVTSAETFYVKIVGNYFDDQQYSVIYNFEGALNSPAVWGTSASYTGSLISGQEIDASVTYSDADGNSDNIVATWWYLDGVYQTASEKFTLTDDHVGQTLTFRFVFYDDAGNLEASNAYTAGEIVAANSPAVWGTSASYTGSLISGQEIDASVTYSDADGNSDNIVATWWYLDGVYQTASEKFTLTDDHVGQTLTFRFVFYDDAGNLEASNAYTAGEIVAANSPAVWGTSASYTGSLISGQEIDASVTYSDADGNSDNIVATWWYLDGVYQTASEKFTLTDDHVGQTLTFRFAFYDDAGNLEASNAYTAGEIVAASSPPTGSVTITGTAAEGQTLTAASTLADPDGLGALSYQWKADGENIDGAVAETLTLSQNEVDKAITVTVSYIDGGGTVESVTSGASSAVTNVNDDPTGSITITGTASQGNDLTAVTTTLADEDGLGEFSYQWLRDGSDISGATSSSYTLTQDDVGSQISARVSYTDSYGQNESVTSTATSAVSNVNEDPTGSVTITGTAAEGQTLTAASTLADPDGLGALSYQWKADGENIDGAVAETLTLSQNEVDKAITVTVSYIDGGGTVESVTSGASSAVTNVNDDPTGSITITGTASQGNDLTAVTTTLADEDGLGEFSYQWLRDGSDISGATSSSYTLTQDDVGSQISASVSYTDSYGQNESVTSTATSAVSNVNDDPTGSVTITGTAAEGQTLTAASTLADPDGLGALSYQWKADGENIDGAVAETLTLSQNEVDKAITVTVSYIDGGGTVESVTSGASSAVTNVNDDPTGSITITGTASQGNDLTAVTTTLADEDGLGEFSYQWLRDGSDISGATSSSYTLTQDDVGSQISASVSYTDSYGQNESVTSTATSAVSNVNEDPTGSVTITGTAAEGQTLTAASTLADPDGLGALSYQWKADGENIDGAVAETLTLSQNEVDKAITVTVSYIDGGGTVESVTSGASSAVTNVNDDPTGSITITGTASQGNDLTAVTTTLADEDGLGEFSYQWLRDGSDISGATSSSYTLTQDDVGSQISARVSYTDSYGQNESVTSTATSAVSNVNEDPTGSVTITGTAAEGQTLTAASTLADPDGLGALSYQWKADGENIDGAVAETLTLSQNEVDKAITVTVSYIDGGGTVESVTSGASSAVTNVNDDPTGSITITGTASQGNDLTAVTTTLADEDGLGEFSYQWLRDGSDISGATSSSYTLTQDDVGSQISARVSYTDSYGQNESVTSTATSAVSNVNEDPTGSVTITGTAAEGQTLTAASTLADPDGLGALSYQWKADGENIDGAVAETLTLSQNEVDKAITVTVSYIDGGGTVESVTSGASSAVTNVNDDPTGSITITGTASQGNDLTAVTTTLADEDGLGEFSYQWLRDGSDISGATSSSYTLTQDDVGSQISASVSYTDSYGQNESVTSTATSAVSNVNDDPTGSVTITGTAAEGQTLTAASTLADPDGLGALSYQWKADGENIDGAVAETLTLSQNEVDKAITVTVSYIDGGGTVESVTSGASSAVTNVNDDPTGSITITGTASQGNDLTAVTTTLADEDGLGEFSYQWLRDGSDISGATSSSYTLTQDDVGSQISASVSYTDSYGQNESVTSTATSAVSNVNEDPTGSVTITGTAAEGQTLTAASTLADPDGLGALSYQWKADGENIDGAVAETLTLSQNEVDKAITVTVSYIDGGGTVESVTSGASSAVTNVNDDPTGSITITGTASQGNDLTAVTTTLADEDGLGEFSYQWLRDGSDISGATSSSYTLTQDDVGSQISARVSYTDSYGQNESVTSTATSAVSNVNEDPTGSVTITGTAAEGQTLTAASTLADPDGLGALSYQWKADGENIDGAVAETLTLSQNEVDKAITVTVSYIDGGGTVESVTSGASSAVTNVNDDPTGSITITGTASQGNDLTAVTTTLADEDGLGEFSYQWLRDGSDISGATSSSYTLTQDDVGSQISASVSYTDSYGQNESVTSAATEKVAPPDIVLSGTVASIETSALENISVSLDSNELASDVTTTLGSDGVFEFTTAPFSAGIITADKAIDKASEDSITANDALQALRLAVGLTKSDGKAEWHDYIAADINMDGQVTANDALNILKFAVGLTDGPPADWVFVDGDADWSGIGRRDTNYEEGVWLENIVADTSVNMTGILVGDVNGSYVA